MSRSAGLLNQMTTLAVAVRAAADRVRSLFAHRHILFHDGRELRRVSMSSGRQAVMAGVATVMIGFSGYGAAQVAYGAAQATGVVHVAPVQARLASMEHELDAMHGKVETIRVVAVQHARRMEQRQALIAAALTGQNPKGGDAQKLALATLTIDPMADRVAADVVKPMAKVEGQQTALAGKAEAVLQHRYAQTAALLGIAPARVQHTVRCGMGGPLIDANSAEASADIKADQQFRSLFDTWKKLDGLQQGVIAIPSVHPVEKLAFTSNFGIRSDPFRGTAAMHAGVDIPGPVGTPVYATADGTVDRAERSGGYGNMVEIDHGKGIATRYGHLSKILVADGTHVHRGQLIALMGSTGRSTGPHLHYEVRIDGHAVNPAPFLTSADYLLAAQDRAVHAIPVSTDGPAAQD